MEANGTRLDEQRFPGRQGRIVFAYLAAQKGRPVPRDESAELLWGDELPATWEKALRVLMTKLRSLLEECGIDGSSALTAAFGGYRLALPDGCLDRRRRGGERGRASGGGTRRGRSPTRLGYRRRPRPRLLAASSYPARRDRGSRNSGAISATFSFVRSNVSATPRSPMGSSETLSGTRWRSSSWSPSARPATAG